MKRYLFFIITLITSLLAFSCQDEDFGFTQEEIFREAYERNFEAKYGKIDPNQSWDLSTYARTRAAQGYGTRAIGDIVTLDNEDYFVTDKSMIDWIKGKLPNNTDNSSQESFGILMGTGEFAIVPLFEDGNTSMDWTLYMVVHDGTNPVGAPIPVWSRSSTSSRNSIQIIDGGTTCGACEGHGHIYDSSSTAPCSNCGGNGFFPGGTTTCTEQGCNHNGTKSIPCTDEDCVDGRDHSSKCGWCGGTGKVLGIFNCIACGGRLFGSIGTGYNQCATCKGTGKITTSCICDSNGKVTPCEICNTNKIGGIPCTACGASGFSDGEWRALQRNETTSSAKAIRTKPAYVNTSSAPEGSVVYFYLQCNNTIRNYATMNDKQSSLQNKMKVISTDKRPANISADSGFRIIGVEEQSRGSDSNNKKDYNDLVFMVVGKPLPDIFEFTSTDEAIPVRSVKKRYMVEDLGSSVDWDFNDIVVDVNEAVYLKLELDGADINTAETQRSVTAEVKYLSGTKPLQVTFGKSTTVNLPKISDPTNEGQTIKELWGETVTPTYAGDGTIGWVPTKTVNREVVYQKFDITSSDWTADNNAIYVKVWKNATDEHGTGIWKSSFPKTGEIPYIIATDQNVQWVTTDGDNIDDSLWTNKADTSTGTH